MLPAQPPHSRRMSLIWNDTDSMCVCSGRMCRAKRSGNTMIVSNASEPQISVRMGRIGRTADGARRAAKCSAAASLWRADERRASGVACVPADFRCLTRPRRSWPRGRSRGRCTAGAATPATIRRCRAAALPNAHRHRRSHARSKPRMKSRATRQLRCTRTNRAPNSSSSRVSDSSSRYSRCAVRIVMYLSSALR